MKYNVTINNKVYEVEVEKGKANLVRTTDVVAAAPAAAPAPAPAANFGFCPACGKPLTDDGKFCGSCGAQIPGR